MSKEHEKLMTDLHRLLETREFKNEKELSEFMQGLIGKEIPSFPKDVLNVKEQAQDLVYEAYNLTPTKAKAKINQALQLDPNCIEAYEFLGATHNSLIKACEYLEKGIAIGRKQFGGKYLKENRGFFWVLHETRPFMRCLQLYSECLYEMNRIHDSVSILEEMIVLNPNDNQGIRDQLMLYLLELNEDKKFLKYKKIFQDENRAFPLFNEALFAFKNEGESDNSNMLLLKALKKNKFVAKKLLSHKQVRFIDDHYGIGDENEADFYASYAQGIWERTQGAKTWLKIHAKS